MSRNVSLEDLKAWAAEGRPVAMAALARYEQSLPAPAPKKHKYRAKPERVDGLYFPSKLEADLYRWLKVLRDDSREALHFFTQVVWTSRAGNTLTIDFLVVRRGEVWALDAKGKELADFKAKRREFEQETGRKLWLIRKGDALPWCRAEPS